MRDVTREDLIDRAWQAMDDRNDLDVSLRDLAEAAVDAIAAQGLYEALQRAVAELKVAQDAYTESGVAQLAGMAAVAVQIGEEALAKAEGRDDG